MFEIVPEAISPASKIIGKGENELVNDDISVRSHQNSVQEKASNRSNAQEGSKRANQSPIEATFKLTKSSPFSRVPSEGSQSTESMLKHGNSPPLSPRALMNKIPPKAPNNSKSKQSVTGKDLGGQSLSPRVSMSKLPPTSPNSSMASKSNSKPAVSGKGICDKVESKEDTISVSSRSSRQSLRQSKSKMKMNTIEASATSKKTKKSTWFKKVKSSRGRGRDRGRKEIKEEMRYEIPTARIRSESRGARRRHMFRRGRSDAAARGPKSTTDDYVAFSKNSLVK